MKKVSKILIFSALFISLPLVSALAGGGRKTSVEWLNTNQLEQNYNENKKPILVDVYTDWCFYCKVMDNTTWKHDSVAAYLKSNFYAVKINAENQQPYKWLGEKYQYEPKYKVNMLAVKLLEGNMVFPSIVIIPVKGEPEVLIGAYSAKELEMILKYYGERSNETTTPDAFMKQFSGKWK